MSLCFAVGLVGTSACRSGTEEFAQVHPCDEYAAHPDDPGKWAPGVAEEDILPGPAVKLCSEAVEEHGATARFHFQLGRALWAAGRIDEGVEAFLAAQELEYAPAYAYLGDAYQEGLVPGEEADLDFSQELYAKAAEGGFAPAAAMLDDDGGFEEQLPTGASAVSRVARRGLRLANPDFFKHPTWIAALHDGDFGALLQVEGINLYLEGMNNFMQPDNYRMVDATCSAVADARLAPRLAALRLGVGLDSSNEEMMLGAGSLLLNVLNQYTTDPMGFARFQAQLGYLMVDGEQDMSTFVLEAAEEGGCVSRGVRTAYGNIARFLDYSTEEAATSSGRSGFQDMVAPPGSERIDLQAEYEASQRRRAEQRRSTPAAAEARPSRATSPSRPVGSTGRRGVVLYSGEHYGGTSERFGTDDPDLTDNGIGAKSTSSVRVDEGCSAVLFSRTHFRGRSLAVSSDTPKLQLGWKQRLRQIHRAGDDSVASIKVACG